MILEALGLGEILGGNGLPAQGVLPDGDRLKVVRIGAGPLAAEVVED
jgi:hypothetical protein